MENELMVVMYRFLCEVLDEYIENSSGDKKDWLLEVRNDVQRRWEVIDAEKNTRTGKGGRRANQRNR